MDAGVSSNGERIFSLTIPKIYTLDLTWIFRVPRSSIALCSRFWKSIATQ